MLNHVSNKAQEFPGLTKNESTQKKKNEESTPIFPLEVIIEILSWLPLKYLSQVQLVCKEWQAVIRDRYVIEKHMDRSSVVHHWHNVQNDNGSHPQPGPNSFSYIHGCDGLVLLRSLSSLKYFIWNPAIRRVLELPDPHEGSYGFALSFVGATGNHRIVSIYKNKESGGVDCEVLTPGPSMTWIHLTFPDIVQANGHPKKEKVSVVSAGGAVHCVLVTKVGEETVAEIVSLDVETECFTVNHLPDGLFRDMKTVWELDWDGKLAIADIVGQNLQLMELEDFKKRRWCEKKKIIPLPFLKENGVEGNVFPLFNKQGDIWFWLKKEKISVYTMKTGKISDVMPSGAFSLKNKLYPYKPSLVTLEGMQPDTDSNV